jgi:hypothetical protein
MITADGGVKPCCVREPVGNLADDTFVSVTNNPVVKELWLRLVNGELDATCRLCPQKPLIGLREFQLRLRAELVEGADKMKAPAGV